MRSQPSVTRATAGGHLTTGPSSCFLARTHLSSKFYRRSSGVSSPSFSMRFLACSITCSPTLQLSVALCNCSLPYCRPCVRLLCHGTRCRILAATIRGGESRRCPWSSSLLLEIERASNIQDICPLCVCVSLCFVTSAHCVCVFSCVV